MAQKEKEVKVMDTHQSRDANAPRNQNDASSRQINGDDYVSMLIAAMAACRDHELH